MGQAASVSTPPGASAGSGSAGSSPKSNRRMQRRVTQVGGLGPGSSGGAGTDTVTPGMSGLANPGSMDSFECAHPLVRILSPWKISLGAFHDYSVISCWIDVASDAATCVTCDAITRPFCRGVLPTLVREMKMLLSSLCPFPRRIASRLHQIVI